MTKAPLSNEEIRSMLRQQWISQPDDPALDSGLSFGESLALKQEAAVFSEAIARSNDVGRACSESIEAGAMVMKMAAQVEAELQEDPGCEC